MARDVNTSLAWAFGIAVLTAVELAARIEGHPWTNWFGIELCEMLAKLSFTLKTPIGSMTIVPGLASGILVLICWGVLMFVVYSRGSWALPTMVGAYGCDTVALVVTAVASGVFPLSFTSLLLLLCRGLALASWISTWRDQRRLRSLGFDLCFPRSPRH